MTLPVGQGGQTGGPGIEQAKKTNLRAFVPADLDKAAGQQLHIGCALLGDRAIKSASYKEGNALETCAIVTDQETIQLAESIDAKGEYGVDVSITYPDGSAPDHIRATAVVNAAGKLDLVNHGSGPIKEILIDPGFASAKLTVKKGFVTVHVSASIRDMPKK